MNGYKIVRRGHFVCLRLLVSSEVSKEGMAMEKTGIGSLPQIVHTGKYGVVYDIAHNNGDIYYASIVGPRLMTDGIAAALLDSGKRNKQDVYLKEPVDGEGGAFWQRSVRVRIASDAFGSMRRITRKVLGTRVYQTVLVSQLVRWDYNYAHIKAKAETDEDVTEEKKMRDESDKRRFVLLVDGDESVERKARRWFGFLPRRVSEPLLAEWAVPLWEYCVSKEKGITPMTRFRGEAYLCEPTPGNLRDAITELGMSGALPLPANFPVNSYIEDYEHEDMAAD